MLSKRFSVLRGNHQELGVVEPFWEAQLAVLVTVLLYVALPARLTVGPRWLVPSLEGVLLVGLAISTPYRHHTQSPVRRRMSIGLILLVTAATSRRRDCSSTICSRAAGAADARWSCRPLRSGLPTWPSSACGFWEVDRGGPHMRTAPEPRRPDFLFPQMGARESSLQGWRPAFLDYLYVAFTNASAFSPTDAMPLSVRIKSLMLIESIASFLTVGLVAARAVNILNM